MSLIYTVICRGNDKVLCEFTRFQGNFHQISRSIIRKVDKNKRGRLRQDQIYFHWVNENNITYMCMCENELSQDNVYAYLDEIKKLFTDTFSPQEIDSAMSYTLNDFFQNSIRGKMDYFNDNSNECVKQTELKKKQREFEDRLLWPYYDKSEIKKSILEKSDNLRTEGKNYPNNVSYFLNYIKYYYCFV